MYDVTLEAALRVASTVLDRECCVLRKSQRCERKAPPPPASGGEQQVEAVTAGLPQRLVEDE